MATPNNTARPVSSKSPRKLSAVDLERICRVEPHTEKKCDY